MIISHAHKYLFVEIPHTASTAISKELRENYGGELVLYKHANYSEFKHQATPAERKYFKFCAVRNPVDIVVTEFSKYKNNHRGVYTQPEAWARNGGWVLDSHLERYNYIEKHNASFSMFFKRFYTSVYNNWFLVGHPELDFIMRFENIGADFESALKQMGIDPIRPLPVRNDTERSHEFADYWEADIYEDAAHVFGPFLSKWGYDFPDDWPRQSASMADRIRFNGLEIPINLAARFFTMSPYNPTLQKISNSLRKVGLTQ